MRSVAPRQHRRAALPIIEHMFYRAHMSDSPGACPTDLRWTLWEVPPTAQPRVVATYPRGEATAMARLMNHEAQMHAMAYHYVARPAGELPPGRRA